ncbi:hypothetical protein [Eubacterium ramulus]
MKCKNCGTEFTEGIFCPECGTKVDVPEDSNSDEVKEKVGENNLEAAAAERKKAAELETQKRKQQAAIEEEQRKREQEEALRKKRIEDEEKQKQEEQLRIEKEKKEKEKEEKRKEKEEKRIKNEGNAMAIASLVLGIVSLCSMGMFVVPEILGIVFAFSSKKQGKMSGIAKAGLICSIIGTVIFVILLIWSFNS